VNSDTADVAIPQFDLASVKASPERQADLSRAGTEG
jgi:hypothetical protein